VAAGFHTDISFFLALPLSEFAEWIATYNSVFAKKE